MDVLVRVRVYVRVVSVHVCCERVQGVSVGWQAWGVCDVRAVCVCV
jgi:hypothetical protein